jgi:hypothetical protein
MGTPISLGSADADHRMGMRADRGRSAMTGGSIRRSQ